MSPFCLCSLRVLKSEVKRKKFKSVDIYTKLQVVSSEKKENWEIVNVHICNLIKSHMFSFQTPLTKCTGGARY